MTLEKMNSKETIAMIKANASIEHEHNIFALKSVKYELLYSQFLEMMEQIESNSIKSRLNIRFLLQTNRCFNLVRENLNEFSSLVCLMQLDIKKNAVRGETFELYFLVSDGWETNHPLSPVSLIRVDKQNDFWNKYRFLKALIKSVNDYGDFCQFSYTVHQQEKDNKKAP